MTSTSCYDTSGDGLSWKAHALPSHISLLTPSVSQFWVILLHSQYTTADQVWIFDLAVNAGLSQVRAGGKHARKSSPVVWVFSSWYLNFCFVFLLLHWTFGETQAVSCGADMVFVHIRQESNSKYCRFYEFPGICATFGRQVVQLIDGWTDSQTIVVPT